MADAAQILASSPAQISIYDATNYTLFLGYLNADNFELKQTPLYHKDIEGMRYQYGVRTQLTVELLETDPGKIANLKKRRTLTQDIYIVGAQHLVKMHDVYIQHAQKRKYTPGNYDVLEITAFTDIETNVEVIKNLLSSVKDSVNYGNFDIDTNTDGLSDGWTKLDTPVTTRNTPSFLGAAYGHDQQYETDESANQGIYCDIICPLDRVPIKITASIYAAYSAHYDDTFKLAIITKNSSGTPIDSKYGTTETATGSAVRYSYSVNFIPGADVYKLSIYIYTEAGDETELMLDNAQLEFGKLTAYTEND